MIQLWKKITSLKDITESKKRKCEFVSATDKLARLEQALAVERQLLRCKLEYENMSVEVKVQPSHTQSAEIKFMYKIMQFQVNLNNTTTGHKLQGMSNDTLDITSFLDKWLRALFKNWECVVLSRVRKLKDLYLFLS